MFSVWLIVFVVFRVTDRQLPWIVAVSLTYALAAYVILPRIVRMNLKILQRKSVPSFTVTGDGLPGDPVNLVLIGELDKLRAAFAAAGWTEADRLGLKSSWRMVVAFVFNRPYPAAPFSTLFLFGRGQDVGFQKAIDGSPRKRHHIRFWALSLEQGEETLGTPRVLAQHRPPAARCAGALGRRGHQGHRHFADPVHLPDYSPDRRRRRRRTRFHRRRAQAGRGDRQRDVLYGRPEPARRTRQPIRDRRRGRCGELGLILDILSKYNTGFFKPDPSERGNH